MNIKEITKHELDSLDLSKIQDKVSPQIKPYFSDVSGKEIYRLLANLSNKFNNETLVDIGTAYGDSALALSYNENNVVYTFDIQKIISVEKTNIKFINDEVYNHSDILLKSPLIYVDVVHDCSYEYTLYNFLDENQYKGLVIFDDIYLNPSMTYFFNSCDREKYDITSIGHWTGTGAIKFE